METNEEMQWRCVNTCGGRPVRKDERRAGEGAWPDTTCSRQDLCVLSHDWETCLFTVVILCDREIAEQGTEGKVKGSINDDLCSVCVCVCV
jgi:hypothetical protein